MGQPVVDLSNSDNWNLSWNNTFEVERIGGEGSRYYPFPPIEMPVKLNSHIFAVLATSTKAGRNWKFAGFLNQRIQTGIVVGGIQDAEIIQARRLFLNRISVYLEPALTSTFSLTFNIPYWFQDISLFVWEYTGNRSDTTEELITEVREQELLRIESKVDDIATYGR